MSLILLEGFDDELFTDRWNATTGVEIRSSEYARTGNVAVLSAGDSANDYFRRMFTASEEHATITVGAWITPTIMPVTDELVLGLFELWSDGWGTKHLALTFRESGALTVMRGTTTQLGSSDIVYRAANESHYVEMSAFLHDTAGTVKVWVDGALVINLSGIDTKNGGTKAVFDGIQFRTGNDNLPRPEFTDIYVTNGTGAAPYNGNLGDIVVHTQLPNANGNYSQFTGSDGNSTDNYLLVDENPRDDDTTYVETSVNGERDSYGFEDIAPVTGKILGVIATANARNTGAAENLQLSTRIGSTDYDSATLTAPGDYDSLSEKVWQVSPATAADWTFAEFNAAEFGIENVV